MLNCEPGNDGGYLAFKMVDALIDLLIEKAVIDKSEATQKLVSLAGDLAKSSNAMAKRCAEHITSGLPK